MSPRNQSNDNYSEELIEEGGPELAQPGQIRNISEVLEQLYPQGRKVKKSDLEGQKIVIQSIKNFTGKYGEALFVVGADQNGELFNTVIASKVVKDKLEKVRDYLPIFGVLTLKESGDQSYWDFE